MNVPKKCHILFEWPIMMINVAGWDSVSKTQKRQRQDCANHPHTRSGR